MAQPTAESSCEASVERTQQASAADSTHDPLDIRVSQLSRDRLPITTCVKWGHEDRRKKIAYNWIFDASRCSIVSNLYDIFYPFIMRLNVIGGETNDFDVPAHELWKSAYNQS